MMEFTHRVALVPPADTDREERSIVARWPSAVVVLSGSSDAVATALDLLHPHDEVEPSGATVVERLPMLRDTHVAAAVTTPDGWQLFATGEARATAGQTTISTGTGTVGAAVPSMWIGIGPRPAIAGEAAGLDLRAGIVPGRGAVLTLPVDQADVSPPDAPSFELVDLSSIGDSEPRAPLPVAEESVPESAGSVQGESATGVGEVMGIRCSRNHFNNPSAAYCQVCGISMVHMTHYLVPGQRPTLGFLVFDDGATFALDRSYRIGREPMIEPESDLAPLVLPDGRHSVSRSHAELLLDGWSVLVSDLGSTNGTFVWDAVRQTWERVMPGEPRAIEPGTVVAIGRKTFVFEAVARST